MKAAVVAVTAAEAEAVPVVVGVATEADVVVVDEGATKESALQGTV